MEAPRRGYLYWVNMDKRRPALVLSPDYRNQHAGDVIVVPCSTRLRPAPTHVVLGRGQGGLAASWVLNRRRGSGSTRRGRRGRRPGR